MSIHLTPESQTPNISPDSIKIIKETNLFTAPAVLYGKTNMLVNWGGHDRWNPTNEELARLSLFSGRVEGLYNSGYGMLKQQDLKIFAAKNNQEWEEIAGKTQDYKTLSPIVYTPFFKVINSPTSGFLGENRDLFEGRTDLCSFEDSPKGGVNFLFAFRPSFITTNRPGLNFLKINTPPETAEKLIAHFKKNPKSPYEIMMALFQSGFIPSLDPENIRTAWREKGKNIFSKINIEWLNKYSGFDIVSVSELNDPDTLFDRASKNEEIMVQNLLGASKTSRHKQQEKLMLVDLRGVPEAEVNEVYKQKTSNL